MNYEVEGLLRKADILSKIGFGWLDEGWAYLSEEQQKGILMREYFGQTTPQ
jgi:hypothetical protein